MINSIVEPKWVKIKAMYEVGTNGSIRYGSNFKINGELDKLCTEFIDLMSELTHTFGWNCVVEGEKMDLWKERIWSLIEKAGLLPEIAWRDDKDPNRLKLEDSWNCPEDEFDYNIETKYDEEVY